MISRTLIAAVISAASGVVLSVVLAGPTMLVAGVPPDMILGWMVTGWPFVARLLGIAYAISGAVAWLLVEARPSRRRGAYTLAACIPPVWLFGLLMILPDSRAVTELVAWIGYPYLLPPALVGGVCAAIAVHTVTKVRSRTETA